MSGRESVRTEAELLDAGEPINPDDVLTAGICCHHGALLVTDDDHFDRVAGIETAAH